MEIVIQTESSKNHRKEILLQGCLVDFFIVSKLLCEGDPGSDII